MKDVLTRLNEMLNQPIKNLSRLYRYIFYGWGLNGYKQRTAQANQIRGLLAEYGIIIALGISHIREMTEILENNKLKLTVKSEAIFKRLYEQFKVYDEQCENIRQRNTTTSRQ